MFKEFELFSFFWNFYIIFNKKFVDFYLKSYAVLKVINEKYSFMAYFTSETTLNSQFKFDINRFNNFVIYKEQTDKQTGITIYINIHRFIKEQ